MEQEVRIPTSDPNQTGVIRWINGGFQFLKEIRSTTGESVTADGVTTETITIIRYIGLETNNFPV